MFNPKYSRNFHFIAIRTGNTYWHIEAYFGMKRIISKIVPLDAKLKINYDTFQYVFVWQGNEKFYCI